MQSAIEVYDTFDASIIFHESDTCNDYDERDILISNFIVIIHVRI